MSEWGDRLLLFCGLLSLLGVTEADQGEKASIAVGMVKKPIKAPQSIKAIRFPGINAFVKTGITVANQTNRKAHRAEFQPSERSRTCGT